jgi:WD40 repeat protein
VLVALAEGAMLWLFGATYMPKDSLRDAVVTDFQFGGDGRWAASQVALRRQASCYGMEWDVLVHDLRRPDRPVRWNVNRLAPRRVAASPCGDWLAIACLDGSVYLGRRGALDEPPRLLGRVSDGLLCALQCSPDGQWIVAAGEQFLHFWRLPTGEFWRQIRHDASGPCVWLSISHDARTLLVAGRETKFSLWDVPSGRRRQSWPTEGETIAGIALSPNAKRVAYVTSDCEARMVDLDAGTLAWRRDGADELHGGLAFSHDGAAVAAFAATDGPRRKINVWCVETGRLRHTLAGHDEMAAGLAFGPDGSLCSWDRKGHILCWRLSTASQAWRFSTLQWASSEPSLGGRSWLLGIVGDPHRRGPS